MTSSCHRCHGQLLGDASRDLGDPDACLFCTRCGSPQFTLPDHLRSFSPISSRAGEHTTGTVPPPRPADPRQINWRAALIASAGVALVEAILTILGLTLDATALLATLWTLSGAAISLGVYRRRARQRSLNARMGMRLGIVTGFMMLASIGVAGSATGIVLRFATHRMEKFDEENREQAKVTESWVLNFLAREGQDKATQDRYVEILNSPWITAPEAKAGGQLVSLAIEGILILLISAGSGALAGKLQGRENLVAESD